MKLATDRSRTFGPQLVSVSKKVGKAITDFGLIESGDRIAVAVSGGKDSVSLLHLLEHRRRVSPVPFEFSAVHVDFDFVDFDPQELLDYLKGQGFSCRVERTAGLEGEKWEDLDCYRFSRQRRKALFEMARREGFTKIAFGHHLDDIVETVLLNQFYKAEISAMKPLQSLFDGKIVIIRPLAYAREEDMTRLAAELGITGMGQSKCAYDDTSHRMIIKKMLRDMEQHNAAIVPNIFRSLRNIKTDYLP